MTDATLPLSSAAPARQRLRPTEEPAWLRRTMIAAVLLALALLVLVPLASVFVEALREGWALALASLAEPDAWAAIRLTLLVAAIGVPTNAAFGIAAAWLLTLIDLPFSVSPVVAGLCIVLLSGANSALGGWLVAQGVPIVFAVPGIVLATMFTPSPSSPASSCR